MEFEASQGSIVDYGERIVPWSKETQILLVKVNVSVLALSLSVCLSVSSINHVKVLFYIYLFPPIFQNHFFKPGIMVYTCNLSTETEAETETS